jgi:hypothetical protein
MGGYKRMLCLQKDYIDQVPVILSGHIQRESQKSCGPPTCVSRQILASPSLSLRKHTDQHAHDHRFLVGRASQPMVVFAYSTIP